MKKLVTYGPEAWQMLQGVFCVYKPVDTTMQHLLKVLAGNLCRDLNNLEPRPPLPRITFEGNSASGLSVKKERNFADDPLVLGPRYQPKDLRISYAIHLHKNISGLCMIGVNGGNRKTHDIRTGRLIRSYSLDGQFGIATDTGFHNGKVLTKASYHHITKGKLIKVLLGIQAGHQQSAVHFLGLDVQSQAAYEAVSEEGLIRPSEKSPPLIYNLQLSTFNPPDFTLEISCINENAMFLQNLVHKIGLQLKSNAVCKQMRCIRLGAWDIQHALLRKHWSLKHIINSMTLCSPMVNDILPKSPSLQVLGKDYSPG